jgi:crotonobetainyl-CoA:carnitine CoA-transferase CaiB-like acyl-CoA transferase
VKADDASTAAALAGLVVVDFGRVLAAPYATTLLGDLGADVIKVERPGVGDETRAWDPPFVGGEATYFLSVNRNKQSLTLNLKAPEGRAILSKLVKKSDVVVENFRTGTMERLGLGYKTLAKLNPRLIYCAISGFGESGPEAARAGYDLVVQAESGIMDITGFEDGPPVKVGTSIADLVAGMTAAQGITLALLARHKTKKGQKVEISMYFGTGSKPSRRGNKHPSIVPYEVFKAADAYLTLGVANNSLWERCCAALEHPELMKDPRYATESARVQNRDVLVPRLNEILGTRSADDWMKRFEAVGVPAGRIRTVAEVCESPHLKARGMIVTLPHPKAGDVKVLGVPVHLHATPGKAAAAPPLLGQHTDKVLQSVLGMKRTEVARLRTAGVV